MPGECRGTTEGATNMMTLREIPIILRTACLPGSHARARPLRQARVQTFNASATGASREFASGQRSGEFTSPPVGVSPPRKWRGKPAATKQARSKKSLRGAWLGSRFLRDLPVSVVKSFLGPEVLGEIRRVDRPAASIRDAARPADRRGRRGALAHIRPRLSRPRGTETLRRTRLDQWRSPQTTRSAVDG